jgi:hypothetical protein
VEECKFFDRGHLSPYLKRHVYHFCTLGVKIIGRIQV